MLQSYKLRLRDGTVLVVDHDGLSTWLMDDKAMVQGRSKQWHPLKDFLAEERVLAKYAARQQAKVRDNLPPTPASPREDEGASPVAPPPSDRAESPAVSEPLSLPLSVDEPAVLSAESSAQQSIPDEDIAPIVLQAPDDETPVRYAGSALSDLSQPSSSGALPSLLVLEGARPVAPPPSDRAESPPVSEPLNLPLSADEPAVLSAESSAQQSIPDEDIAPIVPAPDDETPVRSAGSSLSDLSQPSSSGALPGLLVLADDPAAQRPGQTRQPPAPGDDLPIIPLKPLDDWGEPPAHAASGAGTDEDEGGTVFAETPRRGSLAVPLHWLASACEALFAWWSDGVGRLVRRLSPMFPNEPEQGDAGSSRSAVPEPPPWVSESLTVQVLAEDPTGSSDGNTRRRSPPREAIIPLKPLDYEPRPRVLLKPPPALSELPVLRFAEADEPEDAEDVYQRESLFHAAWLWTKRSVVVIGLLAGGFLAATTWETWLPTALQLGPAIFTEIDELTGSSDPLEQQGRALQEATEHLPHLAPETIKLVLSSSPTGVLDPAEVFRLARDAAPRGVSALTPREAQELKDLWRKLLDELTPAERERVREDDRARTRRVTYASEDRAVFELFARGARALPSRSRERLQALSGKAVAAGLFLPAETAPRATAKP